LKNGDYESDLGSVFILSGEELTIPFGEIKALILTYDPHARIEKRTKRVVVSTLSSDESIEKVTRRAAYCRFGGKLLSESNSLQALTKQLEKNLIPREKTFAVDSVSLTKAECGELGAKIKGLTLGTVSLENPDYVFQVESVPEGFILGQFTQGYKKSDWRARRPRARKFFLPSAIYPKLSRALVNLSRVKEGEIFADPFCGTGSLLIESSLMGLKTIGIDVTKWIARGAALNLKGYSLPYESIIRADSIKSIPISRIDGMSTDVPYGRASSTRGMSTEKILEGFLGSASSCFSSSNARKRYLVVMHPSTIDIKVIISSKGGNLFQLEEEHLLYVHRNLTRAISVLQKKSSA
jgi:tRNA (guanine10-N2)-dimethyltransferase